MDFVTGILIGYSAVTWVVLFYGIMISSLFHQDVYDIICISSTFDRVMSPLI